MTSDPNERPDPEQTALLRQARAQAEASLTKEQRSRLAERLEQTLGGAPPTQPGSPPTPPAPPATPVPPIAGALTAVAGSKAAIGGVSLLLGVGIGFQGRGVYDQSQARPALSAEHAASAAPTRVQLAEASGPASAADSRYGPGASVTSAAASTSAAGSASASASAAAEASAPMSREESLRAERALLDVARTAIGRGQAGAAITALERHAREFPSGRLSEEREGMFVQALLLSGRQGEARTRLQRFRRSFPRSMMLPALEAALGGDP